MLHAHWPVKSTAEFATHAHVDEVPLIVRAAKELHAEHARGPVQDEHNAGHAKQLPVET